MVKNEFGITLSDDVQKWALQDVITVLIALGRMADKDAGFLSRVNSSTLTFTRTSMPGYYGGVTRGLSIEFHADPGAIPYLNIYHEFGHLMDNACGDVFSTVLDHYSGYSGDVFVFGRNSNGIYDRQPGRGYTSPRIWDPVRNSNVAAEQHPRNWEPDGNTAVEEWADMWANYVAGNIDLEKSTGQARFNFVSTILNLTK